MTSDLHAKLANAASTALEIIGREHTGDVRGFVDLVGSYSDGDKGLVIGALGSVINHALAAIDELAISHGEPFRGDDLFKAMAISLPPPRGNQNPDWPDHPSPSGCADWPCHAAPKPQSRGRSAAVVLPRPVWAAPLAWIGAVHLHLRRED